MIRAGEWDTQTKNELYPSQDRKVSQVIVHEQFNPGTLANDPALLILESPVDMSVPSIGLICLPDANENMDGRNCVASGWGKDLFGKWPFSECQLFLFKRCPKFTFEIINVFFFLLEWYNLIYKLKSQTYESVKGEVV